MKIPQVTIHGRFQPPLHINHRNYVLDAFGRAEKVIILITNPDLSEKKVKKATHRNIKDNNPFTYEERVEIFRKYFDAIGIPQERYEFKPFDITREETWRNVLDSSVPNLVNVYGDWSEEKVLKFQRKGYKVIRTDVPKEISTSGTDVRKILKSNIPIDEKRQRLLTIGYVPEAIEGLFSTLSKSVK